MASVTPTHPYDTVGRRAAVADNLSASGRISFTYDSANRMTNVKLSVSGTLGPQVTFTYDAASRLTSLARQDGTSPMANRTLDAEKGISPIFWDR